MSHVKKIAISAMLIASGIILPMVFHSIPQSGSILLPMHIPVLLCGIICGFPYGMVCGIITPLLSSLFTGMPPAAILPSMICELAVYGLAVALLVRFITVKNIYLKTYVVLIGGMLSGRIIYGILNALIFQAGNYSVELWLTASFITALPGIVIQLLLIPSVTIALEKTKLIELN